MNGNDSEKVHELETWHIVGLGSVAAGVLVLIVLFHNWASRTDFYWKFWYSLKHATLITLFAGIAAFIAVGSSEGVRTFLDGVLPAHGPERQNAIIVSGIVFYLAILSVAYLGFSKRALRKVYVERAAAKLAGKEPSLTLWRWLMEKESPILPIPTFGGGSSSESSSSGGKKGRMVEELSSCSNCGGSGATLTDRLAGIRCRRCGGSGLHTEMVWKYD